MGRVFAARIGDTRRMCTGMDTIDTLRLRLKARLAERLAPTTLAFAATAVDDEDDAQAA